MGNIHLNTNHTKKIDYDENPILIDDSNYIFALSSYLIFCITLVFLYKFQILSIEKHNLYKGLAFSLLMGIPALISFLKGFTKRKIRLKNNYIEFLHESNIIETIETKDIISIFKTISIQYHKSQNPTKIQKKLCKFFLPINILLVYSFIAIAKLLFHLFINGFKNYNFFDSIIIYDKNDNFINILPLTSNEREDVRNYFLNRLSLDINNLEIDKTCLFLGNEKITT